MYEYEMQQYRSADLIRRAEQERLARAARRERRAAERDNAAHAAAEKESDTRHHRRYRFARAA